MPACGDPTPTFGDGIEIDYGVAITPKWKDFTFNFGGLDYTYPGANSNSTISS